MSVRTDRVNLIVDVNGNTALNNLNEMKKKAADLRAEMKGLKKDTEEYKNKAAELKQVEAGMTALKKTIGLTALSQKELVAELNKLKSLKGSVTPFTAEFKTLQKDIEAVEKRLYDVRNGVQGFASFWSKVNDQVKQFGTVAAAYLGFQFITSQFQSIIKGAGKLSDQLADLRRVAGLTASEAENLNNKFKELNTRTSTEGLREIAIIAGKLGVAKDDILDFTAAVDQLVVALGDELGDAGEITDKLGKILNVFDGKITGDNISRLGNAFVELANTGAASGSFIADFDQRLSGIAKSAGISLGALSGLGAGLEELGGRVESSSTAIQKLIISIAEDVPKAAKIAGVDVKQFNELFAKDPTEALLLYSQGLVKNKQSFAEVTAAFKDAGEEGARTIETISKLGTSADVLRGRIDLGKKSIQENTAITEAFTLKNETFGATLDKLGKEFNKLISSPAVTNFLKAAVEGALKFIEALKKVPEFISENKVALLSLAVGVALLNKEMIISAAVTIRDSVAKAYNAVVTRLQASTTGLVTAAQGAYIVVTNLLTGRITIATAAQRLYNLALGFGAAGIGTLITVISGAILIIAAFAGKTKELTAAQKAQLSVQAALSEITEKEETTARSLFNQITKTNLGYDEKKKLLSQLIAINPQYLSGLTLENIATAEGQKILDNYITSLRKVNEEKARRKVIDDLEEKKTQLQNSVNDAYVIERDASGKEIGRKASNKKGFGGFLVGLVTGEDDVVEKLNKDKAALKEVNQQLDALYEQVAANTKKGVTTAGNSITGNGIVPEGEGDKKAADKAKQEREKRAQELQRLLDDANKFEAELRKIKADAYNKNLSDDQQEIIAIDKKYGDLLFKAEKFYRDLEKLGKANSEQLGRERILIEQAKWLELNELAQKNLEKRQKAEQSLNDANYKSALDSQRNNDAQTLLQIKRLYADGVIDKKSYEDQVAKLAISGRENEIQVAERWAKKSKVAAKDVADFKELLEKESLDVAIKAMEDRLKAEAEAAEQSKKIQEDRANAIIDFINESVSYGNALLNIQNAFDQAATNKENAALARDKRINEEKKKSYKKLLDDKLINEEQYNRRVAAADEEMDKKERAIKRRQAEREREANIYQAIINTFSAIAEALPNIPLSILAGISGFAQVSAISNQELPELGLGDWIRNGRTHKQGGINANIEKNEAVMSAPAMTDTDVLTVTGTTAQITSALNSRAGGRSWASGAQVQMPAWLNAQPPSINPALPRIMARGGFITELDAISAVSRNRVTIPANEPLEGKAAVNRVAGSSPDDVMIAFINEMRGMREDIKNWPTKVKGDWYVKDFLDKMAEYDAAKNASR